jgi:Zn-dependent protease with chaperone function
MDFFGRQAAARRASKWLVLLFVLAVGAVVVAVNIVVLTVVAALAADAPAGMVPDGGWLASHPGTVLLTSLCVLGVVGLSSLYKTAVLSAGGGAVATSLGGERVAPDTTDPLRRRLLNVVEEMAIASGVPVPAVYVLEREAGINAFAAGHNTSNAAIAVTRGALVHLNRAELQGVIGHEFSHVLNGDMRLNTRLIGLLFGLLAIAMIARLVLRHAPRGRAVGRKGGGAVGLVFAAALAVLILGYVGLFFGRLIQAAVSRRRESLADASAVQFTREPGGLRDALVKIGALAEGSAIADADAEEVAHMLFAPGMSRLVATHPPLVERIRAIDPRFDVSEFELVRKRMLAAVAAADGLPEAATPAAAARRLGELLGGGVVLAPAAVADLVGNPGTVHVQAAQDLSGALPAAIEAATRQPGPAAALLLALALDADAATRGRQLAFVGQELGPAPARAVEALLPAVDRLPAVQRMPVLSRTFPALRQFGVRERERLLTLLNVLLTREGSLSVFAYALRKLAQVQLRDELEPRMRPGGLSLAAAGDDLQVLFSVLADSGQPDPARAQQAYEAGMQPLLPQRAADFRRVPNWPGRLDLALNRLDRLAPAGKEALVEALVRTIGHDQHMAVEEAELLRAVCATVHCPLPPLVATAGAPAVHGEQDVAVPAGSAAGT